MRNSMATLRDSVSRVVRIVKELKVPLPEPLLLLAEIPKFSLFVSTTFDTLLEEAIFKVRGRKPTVVAFPATSSLTDFDDALLEQSGSLVFRYWAGFPPRRRSR